MNKKYEFQKCIVMGTGRFAFGCAKYLREMYQLDCVYEYGSYRQSGLMNLCKKGNIPYVYLSNKEKCNQLMQEIYAMQEKILIISASNTYIFPSFITENARVSILNYHPGFLEKHLGRNAEAWAIYEQDRLAGVTWHMAVSKIDQGKILMEGAVEIDENMTAINLMTKQYQAGLDLFKELIGSLIRGQRIYVKEVAQYGKMHYSYEKPNQGILDTSWECNKISAFLRSMDYGILEVMGRPTILENGIKYCWDSYRIFNACHENPIFSDSKLIKKGKVSFELLNYREMSEV